MERDSGDVVGGCEIQFPIGQGPNLNRELIDQSVVSLYARQHSRIPEVTQNLFPPTLVSNVASSESGLVVLAVGVLDVGEQISVISNLVLVTA